MTSRVIVLDREMLGIRDRGAEEMNTKDCFVKIKCIGACRGRRYGRMDCDSGGTGR